MSTTLLKPRVLQVMQQAIDADEASERRNEDRMNVSIAVVVVPWVDGKPVEDRRFITFTKNMSNQGCGLVVNKLLSDDELLIGIPGDQLTYVRGRIVYRERLPLGCYKLGVQMDDVVDMTPWPILMNVKL